MKRWFSLLLALILACAQLPGPVAAFAEEAAEDSTTELMEAAEESPEEWGEELADDEVSLEEGESPEDGALDIDPDSDVTLAPEESAGEELVFDLGDVTAEDMEVAEAAAEPETAMVPAVCYSRVLAGEAPVYAGAIDSEPFAWVGEGAVVLLPDDAESGRARVAFDTDAGIVEGWVDEALLAPLSDDEISAYMDDAALNGPVSLYNDDPNMPIAPVACRFPEAQEAGEAEGTAPATEEPEAETAEPESVEPEVETAEPESAEPEKPEEEAGDAEPEDSDLIEAEVEPETEPSEAGESEASDEPAEEVTEEQPEQEAEEAGEDSDGEEVTEAPEQDEAADTAVEDGELPEVAEGDMITFEDPAFTLNGQDVRLAVGESWIIEAVDAEGKEIPAQDLTFACDNNNVSVDAMSGMVTAVETGASRITVSYHDERQYVDVTVLGMPASVAVSPSAMVIGVELQSPPLRVTFEEGTGAQYTFTSSDPEIAEVDDNGIVYGRAEGRAVITVYVSETVSASCLVVVEKAPERVTLDIESLVVGEGDDSYRLTAKVPQDAHQEPLSWSSSDSSVVSVDGNGHLTANKASDKPVTITVKTYNKKAAKCSVIVANAPAKVKLNPAKSLTMYKGQKLTPACSVLDANNIVCDVAKTKFSTNNDAVVAVSAAGKLTAKAEGTATITATAYNGVAASVKVTVKPAVNSLTLKGKSKPTSGYMGVGQTWSGWKVTKVPSNAYEGSYTYSSSNSSILKVTNASTGAFKALRVGTAYIIVKSANGKTAKCKVVVKKAPTKLSLSPANGRLKVGRSAKYKFSLNGAGGSYSFTSSNPKVATVSAGGKVKALKAGTTKITLKTYNGKKKTVTLRVYSRSYPGLPGYLTSGTSTYRSNMRKEEKLEYVIYVAQNKLGCRYVWGNFGPSRFDCSGFTYYCFSKIGIRMENSAYRQGYLGSFKKIKRIQDLRRGDLVCFNTSNDGDRSDHVGIYLGNGYFIHASSSAGKVIISQFRSRSSNYYQRNFSWGRRILG